MVYLYDLTSRKAGDVFIAGGKGANLYKALRFGFAVPNGFVVSGNAFADFLIQNQLIPFIVNELSNLSDIDQSGLPRAAERIQTAIRAAKIPNKIQAELERHLSCYNKKIRFAVRSSASIEDGKKQSWAGQFDSYLNIASEEVDDALKQCWASFFNVRALSYNLKAYQKTKDFKFSVVIQTMLSSDISGVAFSVDPTGAKHDQMRIEAVVWVGR